MIKRFQNLPLWNKIVLSLVFVIIVGIGAYISLLFTEKTPRFFPLDNPDAQYRITKRCPQGSGWVEVEEVQGQGYCLEYKGANPYVLEETDKNKFFSVTVMKSDVDLAPLVGKQVKNIKGEFARGTQQCIQNKCITIGGHFIGIDIYSLEVIE